MNQRLSLSQHLSQEDLVLHYYGEDRYGEDRGAAADHLAVCGTCLTAFDQLRAALEKCDAYVVPERDPDYEERLWRSLQPMLEEQPRSSWRDRFGSLLHPPRWVTAAAFACLLAAAFVAGRATRVPRATHVPLIAVSVGQVRERILLVAVSDHIERSQMVLAELMNAPGKSLDISGEQHAAEDLVNENRLYRQTALESGESSLASVLDELEPVLLDIAHSPAELHQQELDTIRRRIESAGIVFKLRILGSNVKQKQEGML